MKHTAKEIGAQCLIIASAVGLTAILMNFKGCKGQPRRAGYTTAHSAGQIPDTVINDSVYLYKK